MSLPEFGRPRKRLLPSAARANRNKDRNGGRPVAATVCSPRGTCSREAHLGPRYPADKEESPLDAPEGRVCCSFGARSGMRAAATKRGPFGASLTTLKRQEAENATCNWSTPSPRKCLFSLLSKLTLSAPEPRRGLTLGPRSKTNMRQNLVLCGPNDATFLPTDRFLQPA